MSEKKPKECEKCGFVDCKCIIIGKISYATPSFDDGPKIEPHFELDKLKEEFNKIKKTENLERGKIEEKIKSSKDDNEIIVLSKLLLDLEPTTLTPYINLFSSLMKVNQFKDAEKYLKKLITTINSNSLSYPSEDIQFRAILGYVLYRNKKYDEALEEFKIVLDHDEKNVFALIWKGVVLLEIKKYPEAIECCDAVIAIDGDNVQAWREKSDILDSIGDYPHALKCINQAISLDENNPIAWDAKGNINQSLGNHEDALECFKKVLTLDENNVKFMNKISVELAELGRFDESKKYLMDIISIDKFHVWAWSNLGSVYASGYKNFTKSLECSSIALYLEPNNSLALHVHAIALFSLNKYPDALKFVKQIQIIEKDTDRYSPIMLMKAELLIKLNSEPEALECYDELLSKNNLEDTELVICLLKKSKLLYNSKDFEKVIICCNAILEIDGNNLEALTGKAGGLHELKKHQESLDCCNEILAIDGSNLDALNFSSSALAELGRPSEAEECGKKMLTIDKNSPTALYFLSFVMKEQKKYPEALKYINRFIEIKPTGPEVPMENAIKLRDELIELIQSK